MGPLPDADAAGNFSAANSLAKTLGEDHAESLYETERAAEASPREFRAVGTVVRFPGDRPEVPLWHGWNSVIG
jgi:hypothetical protein